MQQVSMEQLVLQALKALLGIWAQQVLMVPRVLLAYKVLLAKVQQGHKVLLVKLAHKVPLVLLV